MLDGVNWGELFLPQTPVLEILVRGSALYLALFALLRFVIRREAGALGITDLLVIVLLADAAQNGMAGNYRSITDGLVLVATIVFWSYLLNFLSFRYRPFRRLLRPPSTALVRDGRFVERNLAREMITKEEVLSEIRAHGLAGLDAVQHVCIEPDGMISVIPRKREDPNTDAKRKRKAS